MAVRPPRGTVVLLRPLTHWRGRQQPAKASSMARPERQGRRQQSAVAPAVAAKHNTTPANPSSAAQKARPHGRPKRHGPPPRACIKKTLTARNFDRRLPLTLKLPPRSGSGVRF